jgi:hypothetical protein
MFGVMVASDLQFIIEFSLEKNCIVSLCYV